MSTPLLSPRVEKHTLSTRLVHAGLALSIITQLGTSLVMHGPDEVSAGDVLFQIHRYSGFLALTFAFLFWLSIGFRHRGTDIGALFPWVSASRLRALITDISAHLREIVRGRLPTYDEHGALASAVHGAGLLLMSGMAVTGTIYALEVWAGLQSPEPDGSTAMTIHFALANLVWVYLIAHASMAALHHFARSAPLSKMWSLRS